jgi:hypothetical protein
LLLWIKHEVGRAFYWENRTVCHFCRSTIPPSPRWPFLARLRDALNARFWAPFFKRRGWLLGLWSREDL